MWVVFRNRELVHPIAFLVAQKIFENWVCWSMSRISRIKTMSFWYRWWVIFPVLRVGGSDQMAKVPYFVRGSGVTVVRLPLANFVWFI